jgi:hypothetical protein
MRGPRACGKWRNDLLLHCVGERHCQEAMNDSLADPLYTQLYELYDDLAMTCVVSDQVSFVLKPKLRPEGEPWETKP